jgi:hypothetical protein
MGKTRMKRSNWKPPPQVAVVSPESASDPTPPPDAGPAVVPSVGERANAITDVDVAAPVELSMAAATDDDEDTIKQLESQ